LTIGEWKSFKDCESKSIVRIVLRWFNHRGRNGLVGDYPFKETTDVVHCIFKENPGGYAPLKLCDVIGRTVTMRLATPLSIVEIGKISTLSKML
jgi:hypothetical protein